MTQDELDALPEDGGVSYVEEMRNGRLVRVPYLNKSGALFQGPDDCMMVMDSGGAFWTTGWRDGVLYKRRMRS